MRFYKIELSIEFILEGRISFHNYFRLALALKTPISLGR
jgi:hypothetical protein